MLKDKHCQAVLALAPRTKEDTMHKVALGAVVVAFGALSASGAYAQKMEVTSAEIHKGATIKNEQVFKGFGCTGDNISPSLSWTGAPRGPKVLPSRSTIQTRRPAAVGGTGWSSTFRHRPHRCQRTLAT